MDNPENTPELPEGVQFHWFSDTRGFATYKGCRIPYIDVRRFKGGPEDGQLCFSIDRPGGIKFGLDVSEETAGFIVAFVAEAMAVAAGYTSHGPNSQPANPFAVKCHIITSAQ